MILGSRGALGKSVVHGHGGVKVCRIVNQRQPITKIGLPDVVFQARVSRGSTLTFVHARPVCK